MRINLLVISLILVVAGLFGGVAFGQPTNNPYASFDASKRHWTAGMLWSNVIDITRPPYNADNSGNSDASALIQRAIDDMALQGGGVIYFPQGTYRCDDNLQLHTGIVLRGETLPSSMSVFGSYQPASKLLFPKYELTREGTGTPNSTSFKYISASPNSRNIGLCNLNVIGAGIYFLPEKYVKHKDGYMPKGRHRNVLILGLKLDNVALPNSYLDYDGLTQKWQRHSWVNAASICIHVDENCIIRNNSINSNSDWGFSISNYELSDNSSCSETDYFFDYTAHHGVAINALNLHLDSVNNSWGVVKSPSGALTMSAESQYYSSGITVSDNLILVSQGNGIMLSGYKPVISSNKVDNPNISSTTVSSDGKRCVDGSAYDMQRNALEISAYNARISNDTFRVKSRSNDIGYSANTIKSKHSIQGSEIVGNVLFGKVSLSSHRSIDNVTIKKNEFNNSYLSFYSNTSGDEFLNSISNVLIDSNLELGKSFFYAEEGDRVMFSNNSGKDSISLACFVDSSNNSFRHVYKSTRTCHPNKVLTDITILNSDSLYLGVEEDLVINVKVSGVDTSGVIDVFLDGKSKGVKTLLGTDTLKSIKIPLSIEDVRKPSFDITCTYLDSSSEIVSTPFTFYRKDTAVISPMWNFQTSGKKHSIFFKNSQQVTAEGVALTPGDFVGGFYRDSEGKLRCGGWVQWGGGANQLDLFGRENGFSFGFEEGQQIEFLVWRLAFGCTYSKVTFLDENSGTSLDFATSEVTYIESLSASKIKFEFTEEVACLGKGFVRLNENPIQNGFEVTKPMAGLYLDDSLRIHLDKSYAGVYSVWVESKDFCVHSNSVSVKLSAPPTQRIIADSLIHCGNSAVVNIDTLINGHNYIWNGQESRDGLEVSTSGTVYVEIQNEHGCKAQDSLFVQINEFYPEELISNVMATSCANEAQVFLNVDGVAPETSGIKVEFRDDMTGEIYYSTDNTSELTLKPGNYELKVIDDNSRCSSILNESLLIAERPINCTYDVLSPNGDGLGDTFYFECGDVKIYDKGGNVVHELKGGNYEWDGTVRFGQALPTGLYIAVCESDGRAIDITIIR